jgi:hypothetical protein
MQAGKPAFELPDFDENDMKDLAERDYAMPLPVLPTAEKKPEPITPMIEKIDKIAYPEPELKPEPRLDMSGKPKFMNIRSFFIIKEHLDGLKIEIRNIDDGIENHSSKAKTEKYHALGNALNTIQDKLILIDNKLFDDATG